MEILLVIAICLLTICVCKQYIFIDITTYNLTLEETKIIVDFRNKNKWKPLVMFVMDLNQLIERSKLFKNCTIDISENCVAIQRNNFNK